MPGGGPGMPGGGGGRKDMSVVEDESGDCNAKWTRLRHLPPQLRRRLKYEELTKHMVGWVHSTPECQAKINCQWVNALRQIPGSCFDREVSNLFCVQVST